MATRASTTLLDLAAAWQELYPSAVFSGIVGDLAHALRGGYHISIMDNPPGNYSIVRADDQAPPGGWRRDTAAAIDMNLNLDDMIVCHRRLRRVFYDRATDTRAKYLNGWNGWDGQGNAGRYDMVTGAISAATDDHKWHCHLEVRRRYVDDPNAYQAVLSILSGQSHPDYLEDIVSLTDADIVKLKQDLIPAIVDQVWAQDIDTSPNRYTAGGAVMDSNRRDAYLANVWVAQVNAAVADLKAGQAAILAKLDQLTAPPPDDPPQADPPPAPAAG